MRRIRLRTLAARGIWLVLSLMTGCSLSPSSKLTLFPSGHQLTDATKAVRQTEPVDFPRELDKHLLAPYVVEPGDVLLVQPASLEAQVRLPGDQPVILDGTINLGEYGQPVVAGKTVAEIENLVQGLVEAKNAGRNVGKINVRLVARVSKVYYVQGEVNAPGSFPLSGRETVLDGLIAAGGLTDRASRANIILSRPTAPNSCRIVLPVCYRDIVQLGDTTTNYQLAPGDRIYVATRNLREDLSCLNKNKCDNCNRPQTPCPLPPLPQTPGCSGPDQLHLRFGTPAEAVQPGTALPKQ
jgi:protein involved in polysaccharide export with SLBB domain